MVGSRLSVWHFLVLIAIIPALGLPVLAGRLAYERLAEASTAARVERELLAIEAVDRLREVVTAETATGALAVYSRQVGVPLALINKQLGGTFDSVAQARAATDKALAAMPRIDPFSASIRTFHTKLPKLRAETDKILADPVPGLKNIAPIAEAYGRLADRAMTTEQSLSHEVSIGAAGVTSPTLLEKIHSFDAICVMTSTAGHRAGIFYAAVLSGSQSRTEADRLTWESTRYQVLRAQLDTELDRQSLLAWKAMVADKQFQILDDAIAKGQAATPSSAADRGAKATGPDRTRVPAVRAATHVVGQLSAFLQENAQDTAAIARAEAATARRRATLGLAITSLMIALTIVALFMVGGALRSRLKALAAGAQRLSAGYLEPVAVRGPRELASTSEALNAAVVSLQHVEAKAVILASGDLTSPELEQPAPGPLGAAVHASVSRIVAAVREREELQLQLAHQASHDTLTGLPNRAELDRTLHAALSRASRSRTALSVLFVDLDGFKACNDRFGHAAGDHVLRQTATRLREAIRPGDVVARLGGDEFVIVAEGASPGLDTVHIGERVVAAVSQPVEFAGLTITIGASVGLAGCDDGQATADQLLSDADFAVYRAKASGRGCVVVYDEALRTIQPA